jgi:hypothetical protein
VCAGLKTAGKRIIDFALSIVEHRLLVKEFAFFIDSLQNPPLGKPVARRPWLYLTSNSKPLFTSIPNSFVVIQYTALFPHEIFENLVEVVKVVYCKATKNQVRVTVGARPLEPRLADFLRGVKVMIYICDECGSCFNNKTLKSGLRTDGRVSGDWGIEAEKNELMNESLFNGRESFTHSHALLRTYVYINRVNQDKFPLLPYRHF